MYGKLLKKSRIPHLGIDNTGKSGIMYNIRKIARRRRTEE